MALSKQDREEITTLIKTVVNGNILRVEAKLDKHIESHEEIMVELRPVAEAVTWINSTRRFVMWVGGFATAVGAAFALSKYLK